MNLLINKIYVNSWDEAYFIVREDASYKVYNHVTDNIYMAGYIITRELSNITYTKLRE